MKAAALDLRYAFHWLVDHPGSADDKNALCLEIIGQPSSLFIVLVVCKNTYVKVTQVPLNYVCHQLFSVSFVELVLAAAVHLWVVVYVYRCAYFVVCVFMFRSAKLQTGPSQDRPLVETQTTSSATSAPPQKKMCICHCLATTPTRAKTRQGLNYSKRNSCSCTSSTLILLCQRRLLCLKFSISQSSRCCASSSSACFAPQQALLQWSEYFPRVDCC